MKELWIMSGGGSMGGVALLIAPQVDSRNNRKATQSLTQLVIINQAQLLTYAPPFNVLVPLFLPFPLFQTLACCSLCFLDSRRSRMRSLIIYPPDPWSPRAPLSVAWSSTCMSVRVPMTNGRKSAVVWVFWGQTASTQTQQRTTAH